MFSKLRLEFFALYKMHLVHGSVLFLLNSSQDIDQVYIIVDVALFWEYCNSHPWLCVVLPRVSIYQRTNSSSARHRVH